MTTIESIGVRARGLTAEELAERDELARQVELEEGVRDEAPDDEHDTFHLRVEWFAVLSDGSRIETGPPQGGDQLNLAVDDTRTIAPAELEHRIRDIYFGPMVLPDRWWRLLDALETHGIHATDEQLQALPAAVELDL
jgi:hypothetical protein